MGAVVFGAYLALWLSVRGQHPYTGPSGAAIAAVYSAIAVAIAVSVKIVRRATAGVEGRSAAHEGPGGRHRGRVHGGGDVPGSAAL